MNYDPATTPAELLSGCPQSRSGRRARETVRLGDVVQQIVTRSLGDGYPAVHSVAKMLGLSTRTLQRRLFNEGVTYACVVARSRFDVAQQMLEDPACKVIDVALDVGYSDQAHFARAFARWTGLAPGKFRRLGAIKSRGGPLPHANLANGRAGPRDARDDQNWTAITVRTSREVRWSPVIEVNSSDQTARAWAGRQERRGR